LKIKKIKVVMSQLEKIIKSIKKRLKKSSIFSSYRTVLKKTEDQELEIELENEHDKKALSMLLDVVRESNDERAKSRHLKAVLNLLFLTYFVFMVFATITLYKDFSTNSEAKNQINPELNYIGVTSINGPITAGTNSQTSADNVSSRLIALAKNKHVDTIVIKMNSPGGSPVQSARIYDEIMYVKKTYKKPVYVIAGDICASGCYYIAAAADKIYVDKGSLIGSIGVIMPGFGFVDLMEKLGVERRALTAGSHKTLLDPFSPVDPIEKGHMTSVIKNIHQQFITAVKEGRKGKLKASDEELFNGFVWSGEQAIEIGLADEVKSLSELARELDMKIIKMDKQKTLDKLINQLKPSLNIDFNLGESLPGANFPQT